MGAGPGEAMVNISGGVVYGFGGTARVSGQIDPITPAEAKDIGGLARFTTPIWLL